MTCAVVTGSEGFIGRNFVSALSKRGWSVTPIDIKEPWDYDCRNFFCQSDHHYDLLVHCAAVIGSRQERDENPLAVFEDLSIDQAAIAWCFKTKTPLLYFSSSAAYPTDMKGPFHESQIEPDIIRRPDAGYGFVKLVGERQVAELRRAGVPVYVVRPFSGYGIDQSLDYPFPSILKRAIAREDPLTVWSDVRRDFIHVDDVVGACLAMVRDNIPGPVNIGSGVPTKMTELARLMATAVGYAPEIKVLGQSVGPDHRHADLGLLRTFYQPQVSLEMGIARALASGAVTSTQ